MKFQYVTKADAGRPAALVGLTLLDLKLLYNALAIDLESDAAAGMEADAGKASLLERLRRAINAEVN